MLCQVISFTNRNFDTLFPYFHLYHLVHISGALSSSTTYYVCFYNTTFLYFKFPDSGLSFINALFGARSNKIVLFTIPYQPNFHQIYCSRYLSRIIGNVIFTTFPDLLVFRPVRMFVWLFWIILRSISENSDHVAIIFLKDQFFYVYFSNTASL